jgi:tetratricopeptide (TPR) repeat protein
VASTEPVAELTTVDLDAYHAYFEGETLLDRLDFDGAGRSFQAAIKQDSTFALAYYRLAYTEWWARGQQELARRHVSYAMRNLQRIPFKERYLVRALSAALEDGFEAQAVILRDMRRLYPDDKEMLFGLGDAEFHSGSTDSAIVHFRAALAIDPVMERALQHLTWAYQRKGLDDDALATAQRWVDATQSIEAYEFLSACYARAGKPAEAMKAIEVARERSPQDPIVPIRMAVVLFMQRRIDDAMAQARAAEALLEGRHHFTAEGELLRLRAGILYPYLGRFQDVQRVLDETEQVLAKTDSASIGGIHVSKAVLGYWGHQDAGRARDELERIEGTRESYGLGDLAQVKIMFNLVAGDTARAGEIARAYRKDLSPDGRAVIDAMRAVRSGDCGAGSRLAAQRKSFGPNRSARDVLRYWSACCHIDAGRADLAVAELLAVVNAPLLTPEVAPIYPAVYFQLGRAYEATGDTRRSIQAYETLLSMWAHGDENLPLRVRAEERLRALKRSM